MQLNLFNFGGLFCLFGSLDKGLFIFAPICLFVKTWHDIKWRMGAVTLAK